MHLVTEFVNRQRGDAVVCVTGAFDAGMETLLRTAAQQELELVQLGEGAHVSRGYLVSIDLPDSRKLHLLQVPGPLLPERYIDPLGGAFVGFVILVDRGRSENFLEARLIRAGADYRHAPSVIAATLKKGGSESPWTLEDLRLVFKMDADAPLLECDLRSHQDCIDTITALLNVCPSTPFVEGLRTSFARR